MAKMDEQEFNAVVSSEIEQAIDFIDQEISPNRAIATDFYHGRPFGNEDEDTNRSKMVSTDVRDNINAMIPSLMRIFTGSEKAVEFSPTSAEDVEIAEQATDYANYVFFKENDGFTVLDSTFKDSLIRKCGIVKAFWEDSKKVKIEKFTGLDENTLLILQSEPDTEVKLIDTNYLEAADEMGMPFMVASFDVEVKKTLTTGRIVVESLPQEEFIMDRRAITQGLASIVGHRRMMTVSDLVEMGYKLDEIEQYLTDEDFEDNEEYINRTNYVRYEVGATNNNAMRRALYVEAYIRIDRDGDGVAELLKVCTLGSGYKVFKTDPCDCIPFALFPCDPEPHLSPIQSNSVADKLMDIQLLKSEVWRQSLDALAQSIVPRTVVIEGKVNIEDAMNKDVGAIIRVKEMGAVQDLITPDVSGNGLNMIAYADSVKERRTGMGDMAQGLEADALSSQTRIGANAMVTASQMRLELLARYMANGMKDLFKIILHLTVTHQDKPKMIRLRNEWVQIDPRYWNSEMDVTINVALGAGTDEQKLMMLGQIKMAQEQILQLAGVNNPIVTLPQYSNTLSKIAELAGFKDASKYFTQLPADFQMPEQAPVEDPNVKISEMLAQVEREKAQAKMQIDAAKLQADQQVQNAKLELEREKMQAEFARKTLELEMQEAKMVAELRMKEAEMVLKQLTAVKGNQDYENTSANEENYQEANEARQEGMLAQAITALGAMIAQSQQSTTRALSQPKMIIRDQTGRPVGIQPVQQENEVENDD